MLKKIIKKKLDLTDEYLKKFGEGSLEWVNFHWYPHHGVDDLTESMMQLDIDMLKKAIEYNQPLENDEPEIQVIWN